MKTSTFIISMILFVGAGLVSGCGAGERGLITFSGTVDRVSLEGGFYGIVSDEGVKYDPVNLAPEFRRDGLRVRATVRPLPDRASFHMWGEIVEVVEMRRIGARR
ncbi:MAG: hypothetical protein GF408_03000 [Candidatus Omnitrophica bacterium]|nr:hypothetical protein [Candidatus Omnitrophota bacterium]